MNREDTNYILVHVAAFLIAYSGALASTPDKWYSWDAINKGLIGSGIVNVGINSVPKLDMETVKRRLAIETQEKKKNE